VLLAHKREQRPLRLLLRFEELLVQPGRLLLQCLKGGQRLLRHPEGLGQPGVVRGRRMVGHRASTIHE
jgi:hypothetical protein